MPVLNLSNTPDNNFEPIPAGTYSLEVVEIEEREGKDSGKPYLNVQFAVPADADEFANRRIFCAMTMEESKAFMLVQFLRALGYTDEELAEVVLDEEFYDNVTGTEVEASVAIQKQEGYDPKNVIKKFIYTREEAAGPDVGDGGDSAAF